MAATHRYSESLHFCQIHHDDRGLSEDLAAYVTEGIEQGTAAVVVASPARILALQAALTEGVLGEGSVGRLLTLIDSDTLLSTFMRRGEPRRKLFLEALHPILRDAATATAKAGRGPVRVYGEMVNDLWRCGNPEAAIQLEQLWNELLQEQPCSLFCGYVLDAFELDSCNPLLEELCTTHSHVAETSCEEHVRTAIDEACQRVLGIPLSSILRHSKLAHDDWHRHLPLSRRAILWLKKNTPSRLTQVLRIAEASYASRSAITAN